MKKLTELLWFFLITLFLLAEGLSEGSKEIKIGVLLPMTGYWPIGTRIAGSIPLAVDDIVSSPFLLSGYNISYSIHKSGCIAEKGIRGMVMYKDMDIIIGPACSTVTEPVALLCKIWNKPIITYAASSTKFIDKTKFSTLATVTAYGRRNIEYTTTFVTRMMKAFNWTVCGILSSSEAEWKNLATELSKVLITAKTRIPLFETYYADMNKEPLLKKVKERARVILLLAYIKDITEFMTIAKRLGMTNGEYAFVTIDLNTDIFYTKGRWTGNEGPGTQFDRLLNGILDLSVQRPILSRSFMDRYRGKITSLPVDIQTQLIPNISWYAAFMYDSIWLAGRAFNATIKQGHNINNTEAVVKNIFNNSFTGQSGKVLMHNGNRVPNFVLGNIQQGHYKMLFNKSHEMTDKLLLDVLHKVVWLGGSRNPPRSTPECGFDGEFCKDEPDSTSDHDVLLICLAIVGFIVALATLLLMRKRHLNKETMYKAWLISYSDLTATHEEDEINQKSQIRLSKTGSMDHSGSFGKDIEQLRTVSRPTFDVALYKGKKVYVKRINEEFLHVSRQVKNDIRQACELRHVNINPYLGVCIDPLDLCIISEYCTKGRLQDILFDDYLNLDWNFKMSFSMDIARGMEELHKSPISFHGSLKSTNIVVDGYWICKIADFGLRSLRSTESTAPYLEEDNKFSELLWTAPEQLRQAADTEQQQAGDVYSYSIVLQEIVLREKPFSTNLLGPKEIVHHVKKGIKPFCRPTVPPDSAPVTFRELMAMGWDEIPERRPTFSGVLKILKKINNGKAFNIVDNMLTMMGKYTNNLESLVKERTRQLETEKAKTDELLYRMMPRSIADKLKAGSQMKAESYDHVTVFFSEIVDFTGIADLSTPRQVINLLNDLYSLYDTVIARYDVFKVMTVCDSFMVVSGLPERNGIKHAAEIASMALHLLFYFKDFKIQHLPNKTMLFKMAMHTGPCVAGVVGLKTPRYDVFGNTVMIAKELEATGQSQNIHMSEKSKSFLEQIGGFKYKKREESVSIKGIGETTTYFLTGKKAGINGKFS